jgi:protein gp37
MAAKSNIEWTDATWGPTVGCTKVSAGCDHCYAETLVNRFAGSNSGFPNRFDVMTIRGEATLTLPLKWRKPKMVFVNSLSDPFHADVPDEFIAEVWAVMSLAPRHTFQILTKRHARMRSLTSSFLFRIMVNAARMRRGYPVLPDSPPNGPSWPLRNVWLGVSVENQQWADIRIPALLDTPAAVRFLSCEPLLGPVELWLDITRMPLGKKRSELLHWVIVGGESGPGARPMHPDWARLLRDQCTAAGVPFLFKQWGNWVPITTGGVRLGDVCMSPDGDTYTVDQDYICAHNESDGGWLRNVGKKAAGRELDGRTWDEFPAVPA